MIVKVKNNNNTGITYIACVLQLNTLEIHLESQMVWVFLLHSYACMQVHLDR